MHSNTLTLLATTSALVTSTLGAGLAPRNFGCKSFGDRMSKACCGAGDGFNGQYQYYQDWNKLIDGMITSSFLNGRGNKDPRSTCDYGSGKGGVCISWAAYTRSYIDQDLMNNIKSFSNDCARAGASSQFYVRWNDGSSGSVCVSSNPNHCHSKF